MVCVELCGSTVVGHRSLCEEVCPPATFKVDMLDILQWCDSTNVFWIIPNIKGEVVNNTLILNWTIIFQVRSRARFRPRCASPIRRTARSASRSRRRRPSATASNPTRASSTPNRLSKSQVTIRLQINFSLSRNRILEPTCMFHARLCRVACFLLDRVGNS